MLISNRVLSRFTNVATENAEGRVCFFWDGHFLRALISSLDCKDSKHNWRRCVTRYDRETWASMKIWMVWKRKLEIKNLDIILRRSRSEYGYANVCNVLQQF